LPTRTPSSSPGKLIRRASAPSASSQSSTSWTRARIAAAVLLVSWGLQEEIRICLCENRGLV
jgi:hypothetical protein